MAPSAPVSGDGGAGSLPSQAADGLAQAAASAGEALNNVATEVGGWIIDLVPWAVTVPLDLAGVIL